MPPTSACRRATPGDRVINHGFTLEPSRPLTPGDAAVGILHSGDGRYLLQRRDAVTTIFYPDHWGFFGGALEPGETAPDALRRELLEELAFGVDPDKAVRFGHITFGIEAAGIRAICRSYFDVVIDPASVSGFRLGEGAAMELVDGYTALHAMRLVPYDAFALWLHYYRGLLGTT